MSSNNDSSTDSESSEESSYEPSSDKDSSVQKSKTKTQSDSESNSEPNKSEKSENTDKSDSDNSQKQLNDEDSNSTKTSENSTDKNVQAKEPNPSKSSEEEPKSTHSSDSEKSKQLSENESEKSDSTKDNKSTEDSTKSQPKAEAKNESKPTSKTETKNESDTTSKTEKSSESSDSEENTSTKNSTSKEITSSKNQMNSSDEEEDTKPFDFTVVSKYVPQNLKTDRFGWAIDEEQTTKVTKKDKKFDKVNSEKERERETKWLYMMKKENWKKFYKKNGKYRKVLERRVKKGIPDCLRSRAWHLILDPKAIDNPTRQSIDFYYDKGVPSCDYVIRVDIPRTMPRVPMFNRKDVRISLYRVLRAYSNADPELGYYQGMAFSAAILMSYMDETSAFWSFVGLMKGKDHNLRDFYDNQFTRLKEINKVWDYILLKKFKDVHDNLKKNNIEHLLYTTSWFLCAFMNIGFEPALRLRIFDRFTLFGPRALISFGLTIVDMNKTELASGAFDVVIPILQNPHQTPSMQNWREIIKVYDRDFITNKDYKHYFMKAGVRL